MAGKSRVTVQLNGHEVVYLIDKFKSMELKNKRLIAAFEQLMSKQSGDSLGQRFVVSFNAKSTLLLEKLLKARNDKKSLTNRLKLGGVHYEV